MVSEYSVSKLSATNNSLLENSFVVDRMIASELVRSYCRLFCAPHFEDLVISPLGLIPKKEPGVFRLLHDL